MIRVATLLALLLLTSPAAAQTSAEVGQMRVYIQQLEQRVRELTGQNEQLAHELAQLRAQIGQAPTAQTGASVQDAAPAPPVASAGQLPAEPAQPGQPAPEAPAGSIAGDDPLIAQDGALPQEPIAAEPAPLERGGPIDLSVLAEGDPAADTAAQGGAGPAAPAASGQVAALPGAAAQPPAPTGSPREQYEVAYGYILTGDYGLAEQSFKSWIEANPSDPQAVDAQFWLGESQFQQKEFRDAANSFLTVYKQAGQSPKAPDALLKLAMSLSALGEKPAACATLSEVGKRYPQASPALLTRVNEESGRAGC
jgi:tol-pal system protein YbgF